MLNAGCLQKNTGLYEDIAELVELYGWKGFAASDNIKEQKRLVHPGRIWKILQSEGIEVDMQTVGEIYNKVFPKAEYEQFMADDDVERYALINFRRQAANAALLEAKEKYKQVGFDASERAIVDGLFNLFAKTYAPDQVTKSMMIKMQDILWKAMRSKLNLPKAEPKDKEGWQETIARYLDYQNLGYRDVEGKMNNLQSLFDAMQEILQDEAPQAMLDALEGLEDGDEAIVERFMDMVKKLNGAAMGLFFTEPDAKRTLYGLFTENGYGLKNKKGEVIGIDWNKLAGNADSVDHVRAIVHDILEKHGYAPNVIESIKDSFQEQFDRITTTMLGKQLGQSDKMAAEATRRLLSEDADVTKFLKDPKTGKTMKIEEWMKTAKIEDVADIAIAARDRLDELKFQPGVRAKIISRLKDFFNKNYLRVESREAQKALEDIGIDVPMRPRGQRRRTTAAGAAQTFRGAPKTPLQWLKENGLHNEGDIYNELKDHFKGRNLDDQQIRHLAAEFRRLLDLENTAEKELATREKALSRPAVPVTKSDMRRLAEAYNLGAFGGNHEKILNSIAGVDALTQQDIDEMQQVAAAASDLYRDLIKEMGGPGAERYMNREFQRMQNAIDNIVARNINNKTVLTKIAAWTKAYFDGMMSGFLISVFNISRNIIGNAWETVFSMTAADPEIRRLNLRALSVQRKVFWAMLKDVSKNGQAYGNSLSDFSPSLNMLQQVKFGWKRGLKNIPRNMWVNFVAALAAPAKAGLNGVDSAFLVMGMNNHFNAIWFNVLTTKGGMSKQGAYDFMNEHLYGEAFEEAKVKARKLLENLNKKLPDNLKRKEITNSDITITANELVKANVVSGGAVSNELLEVALNSAYGVAGLGLGHNPNNKVSETIKAYRQSFRQKERALIDGRQWNKLAGARLLNSLYEVFALRFTGGAMNWLKMAVQKGTGYPILKFFLGAREWKASNWKRDFASGLWFTEAGSGDPDFVSKKALADSFFNMQAERAKIARGLIGLVGIQGIGYLLKAVIEHMMRDDDEVLALEQADRDLAELKRLKAETTNIADKQEYTRQIQELTTTEEDLKMQTSLFAAMRANPLYKRMFTTLAPDFMVASFYIGADDRTLLNIIRYVQNTTGMRYSAASYLDEAARLAYQHDEFAAWGMIGKAVGDRFSIPAWRPLREAYQLAQATRSDVEFTPDPFPHPTSLLEGMLGGGALEAVGGQFGFHFDPYITGMPGVGEASYNYYKAHGITTMEDLRNNPGWEDLTKPNGQRILNPDALKKAKKFYENYSKETWGENPAETEK